MPSPSVSTESEGERDLRTLVLFGTDWMKITCIRNTGLYGIMSAIGTSVGYHLLTSRSPTHVFTATFISFTIPYWINCRKNHRDRLSEVRVVKTALSGEVKGGNSLSEGEQPVWIPSVGKETKSE
nr:uncharacterized protein LOC121124416 [Lepeophtheirus salmonis]